jgi:hypothetical protein
MVRVTLDEGVPRQGSEASTRQAAAEAFFVQAATIMLRIFDEGHFAD